MSLRYQIVLHKSEEGYAVNCPALPGCWSQGETEQEAIQNIRDAIEDYLAAVTESVRGSDVRRARSGSFGLTDAQNSGRQSPASGRRLREGRVQNCAAGQTHRHE